MSTKNLARTIIEGGRAPSNTQERRQSARAERKHNRRLMRLSTRNPDIDADGRIKTREPVRKDFDDKLRPKDRWLKAQVGKLWDIVYSNLRHRYDIHATKNRHLLFDHLLTTVFSDAPAKYPSDYFIDDMGILRKRVDDSIFPKWTYSRVTSQEIDMWLNDRRINKHGSKLYWCLLSRRFSEILEPGYRQDRELTAQEVAFFNSWSKHDTYRVLSMSQNVQRFLRKHDDNRHKNWRREKAASIEGTYADIGVCDLCGIREFLG